MASKVDLDSLVARTLVVKKGSVCWASSVKDPQAIELIRRLRELRRTNNFVNSNEVMKILQETFNIRVSARAVRSHLAGECRCD